MEIHQLRYFCAVARNGTFTRASAAEHVAQPSLSQQILKLEAELGARLFDRLPRSAKLTVFGRAFLPKAARILRELDEAKTEMLEMSGREKGEVALGVIPTITAFTTTATLALPTFAVRPTSPLAPPSSVTQTCANYVFCPSGGPPDGALAPTGAQCPQNYIWGRIVDKNGKGISGVRIRFKNPMGNTDSVESKGPPDPPGIYNILSPPPGGSWLLWVLDAGGGQASPQYAIVAPQSFTGSGNCPTRVDFRAQR